jgi:hypothetical protein
MAVARTSGLDGALPRIERLHTILVAVAAITTAVLVGAGMALSVILGGGVMLGNVWLFKQLFGSLVRRRPERRRLAIALLFAKLPLLWGLLWLGARARVAAIDGAGVAFGISCFPLAVLVVALIVRPRGTEKPLGARGEV